MYVLHQTIWYSMTLGDLEMSCKLLGGQCLKTYHIYHLLNYYYVCLCYYLIDKVWFCHRFHFC